MENKEKTVENKERIVKVNNKELDIESGRWQNVQANYSAMMYILTEQQALIGSLLDQLLENGVINQSQLVKITKVYGDQEVLNPVYAELYQRFATYFQRVKDVLDHPEVYQPQTPFPKGETNAGDDQTTGQDDRGGFDPTKDPDPV